MFQKLKNIWNEESAHLKKLDYLILGILILVYSVISFYHLGSLVNPQTYFYVSSDQNAVTVMLTDDATDVTKMRHFTGPEMGTYQVLGSVDGINYESIGELKQESVFSWNDFTINKNLKYLKIVGQTDGSQLGEIQLYDRYGYKLDIQAADDVSTSVVDELDTVPDQISYLNSTYFDEIYFARTAYEYSNGLTAYEWVHPPLGKVIQMIPIMFLGMNPFAYRLMGNIAGILMIPIIYIFAKNLFKKRKYAMMAGSLMALDTFHFAQSRMGTVDTFLVLFILLAFLFMYQYISYSKNDKLWKRLLKLLLSGISIGCAIATKWTGLFGGLALAIIFFGDLIYKNFGKEKRWTKDTTVIVLSCFLFFIGIPLAIYIGIYFLYPNITPYQITDLTSLWNQTQAIYQYHSTLEATHPFTSPWYSWPVMLKPVWYYVAYFAGNMKQTIVGIGNPAIWWMSIVSFIYLIIQAIRKHSKESLVLLVAILCLWLPYLFIGRVMFMYHFFPVLPFMILAIVALFKFLTEKLKWKKSIGIYMTIVLIMFVIFYPVVSGTMMPEEYIDALKWLPTWVF